MYKYYKYNRTNKIMLKSCIENFCANQIGSLIAISFEYKYIKYFIIFPTDRKTSS